MADGDIYASIQTGYWSQAEFDANPEWLLGAGQRIDLEQTGRYKLGDGVSELQDLAWLGDGVDSVNGQTGTVVIDHLPPRVTSITSSATPTPNVDTTDQQVITALAVGATFGAPTGTPIDGQSLVYAVKDNGTSRSLALNAVFVDLTGFFPSATTVSKWLYFGAKYNSAAGKWHILAVVIEP